MEPTLTSFLQRKRRRISGKRSSRSIKRRLKKNTKLVLQLTHHLGAPFTQTGVTEDPRKTIVVGRLNFETGEEKLRDEFKIYGKIKTVRLIRDREGKSRGYAFIEFESRREFLCKTLMTHLAAYKQANGKTIEGRQIMVDAEMGRMKEGWRPRRFGGGRGDTRRSKAHPYRYV